MASLKRDADKDQKFLSKNSYQDVQLLGEKLLLLSILQVVLPGSKQGKETTKMSMYLLLTKQCPILVSWYGLVAESVESSLPLSKSDPFSTSSPLRLVPIYPSMVITTGDSRRIRRW